MVRCLIISLASVLILLFISYDHSIQLRTRTTGGLSEKIVYIFCINTPGSKLLRVSNDDDAN